MKKLFRLLAVTSIIATTAVQAQDINIGGKVGINIANISVENESPNTLNSIYLGAFVDIPLSDKFSVQPELLYSAQGFNAEDRISGSDIKNKINYLNIPIIAKYYLTEAINVQAGPQIGLLLAAKVGSIDVKEFYETIDFGLNFGLAYEMDFGLRIEARYNLGLADIHKGGIIEDGPITVTADDLKISNRVIQIGLAYAF